MGFLVPKIIDIGIVHGFCDAHCIMCPVDSMQSKEIMSLERFAELLRRLAKHEGIERINLVGMGETVLDKTMTKKVELAKGYGHYVSVITNGHALDKSRGKALLDADLDEILFSVDSTDRETYERIRVGLSHERVVRNVHDFIALRDSGNYATKILVRIIVQEENEAQIDDFVAYWEPYLSTDKADLLLSFPEHNWPLPARLSPGQPIVEKTVGCRYVYDRLVIDAKGNVQFCCADNEANFFELGNVFEGDPVDLFNGAAFQRARELMSAGRINEIDPCKFCTIPLQKEKRAILRGTHRPTVAEPQTAQRWRDQVPQ
jgi:sulfatase maturation enzyme AslB (radical SAM superfamily)